MRSLPLVAILALICASSANGAKERDDFREGDDRDDTYQQAIRRVLWQGFRNDVVLRMLTLGAFGGEDIVGIRRVASGYRVFTVAPSSHIWDEEVKRYDARHPDFSKIRSTFYERPIPETLVRRCIAVWVRALRDRRNYPSGKTSYLDSTHFYFFVRVSPNETLAAHTHNFLAPSGAEIINVGERLAGHPDQRIFERDLDKALRRSERRFGMTRPPSMKSNQALQRTAGRSAFLLSMTSTFNQQPHAPSPAVADLVSR